MERLYKLGDSEFYLSDVTILALIQQYKEYRRNEKRKSPGRPKGPVIDWLKVMDYRRKGKSWRQVAEALGTSHAQLHRLKKLYDPPKEENNKDKNG